MKNFEYLISFMQSLFEKIGLDLTKPRNTMLMTLIVCLLGGSESELAVARGSVAIWRYHFTGSNAANSALPLQQRDFTVNNAYTLDSPAAAEIVEVRRNRAVDGQNGVEEAKEMG